MQGNPWPAASPLPCGRAQAQDFQDLVGQPANTTSLSRCAGGLHALPLFCCRGQQHQGIQDLVKPECQRGLQACLADTNKRQPRHSCCLQECCLQERCLQKLCAPV